MLIAVTGANGFVGKNLCRYLEEKGMGIRRIGRSKEKGVININKIDSLTDWDIALKDMDVVIHCASKVEKNKSYSIAENIEFNEVNFHGTKRLIEKSLKSGVKRFIYLSSIKVNGEFSSQNNPFTIHSEPNPQGEYALSKFRAENELKSICKGQSMEYVIVRLPLVYGPGVKGNFLKLMKLVNLRIPLPFKSIKNNRSIIYIGNLIFFLYECINSPLARNQTLLLSDKLSLSTSSLIKAIGDSLGVKANLMYIPDYLLNLIAYMTNKTDTLEKLKGSLEIDSEESYKLLGINPCFSTSHGLKVTAAWFKAK